MGNLGRWGVACVWMALACAPANHQAPEARNERRGVVEAEPAKTIKTLRDVDWKNREYVSGLDHLVDGHGELREYSEEFGGHHDSTLWRLLAVSYGDFDGTSGEEAVVLVEETYHAPNGAHAKTVDVYVYRLQSGAPELVGRSFDMADLVSAQLERGRLVLRTRSSCVVYQLAQRRWVKQAQACP